MATSAAPPDPEFALLYDVRHTATGDITASASSYAIFMEFFQSYEDVTHAQFVVHKIYSEEPMRKVFKCRYSGKADFKARQLLNERDNHSSFQMGCCARLTAYISAGSDDPVHLLIHPSHNGHTPGATWEVPELRLHPE